MPRRPRLDQPGLPQHVIRRGNNRSACFFADDDCDVNATYKRSGTLWEGRYKALDAVDYLLRVYREELEAAQQAKKEDGRKRKHEPAQIGEQSVLF